MEYNNTLNKLINAQVRKITKLFDYWTILLNIGIINIYNPLVIQNNNPKSKSCDNDFNMIFGQTINTIKETENKMLIIELSNDSVISISLKDEDYCGPEAMNICLFSGETIVI